MVHPTRRIKEVRLPKTDQADESRSTLYKDYISEHNEKDKVEGEEGDTQTLNPEDLEFGTRATDYRPGLHPTDNETAQENPPKPELHESELDINIDEQIRPLDFENEYSTRIGDDALEQNTSKQKNTSNSKIHSNKKD